MRIIALFTCFNRKVKTEKAIRSLVIGNPGIDFNFMVVDDGSNDGTPEMLQNLNDEGYEITCVHGRGNLFYSGGMRVAMEELLKKERHYYDYILMMNDDVAFAEHAIEKLAKQSEEKNGAVIVGVTCDSKGSYTYGAICYTKGIHYIGVGIESPDKKCDTFNANCVLIPKKIFDAVPIMDNCYIHSLGDFDYGLSISKRGYCIYPSKEYVGICERNNSANTWGDRTLSRYERYKKKESVKGAPTKQWFYFLKKNFGITKAVLYSATPYLRILLKR